MKIVKIELIDPFPLYDISVENEHCFELGCGIVAHNSMFPRQVTSGGTGITYSSNDIWIVGRNQEKDNSGEVKGYNFIINVEKSRRVKEKSKIEVNVTYEDGVSKFSNILPLAIEFGVVSKQPAGWYIIKGTETKCREKDLYTDEFLNSLLNNEEFKKFVEKKYKI